MPADSCSAARSSSGSSEPTASSIPVEGSPISAKRAGTVEMVNADGSQPDTSSHVSGVDTRPSGDGVEVDPQLVRVVEVVGPHRMRVQVDAPEVDHPRQLRGVAHDDLSSRATRRERELDGLDPVGPRLGSALLEEELALRAV